MAFDELLRRHILPLVDEYGQELASSFQGGSGMAEVLHEAAQQGRVPPKYRQDLLSLERKFMNRSDEELLSKARQDQNLSEMVQQLRRIIKELN